MVAGTVCQGFEALAALLNPLANRNRGSGVDPGTGDLVWWKSRIGSSGGDDGHIHPSQISKFRIVRRNDSDDAVHQCDRAGRRLLWFEQEVIRSL